MTCPSMTSSTLKPTAENFKVTMPRNTLYVTGFTRESKAADLAPDFEKYVQPR